MPDELETILRTGAEQFGAALRSPAAEQVRARGDRRRRRTVAAAALVVVAVLTGAAATAQVLAGPAQNAPSNSAGPLHLVAPREYLPGVPNPVTFTIPGTGRSVAVTVTVDLGSPSYPVYRWPTLLWRDTASGQWLALPLTSLRGDFTGHYGFQMPATGSVQHLLIVPAGASQTPPSGAGRVRISVFAGNRLVAVQQGPSASLAPFAGTWRPGGNAVTFLPRTGSRQLSFTLVNPVAISYRVRFRLYAFLCPQSSCHSQPPGIQVQWLRAGRWQDLGPAAWAAPGNGQLLEAVLLPAHGSRTLRFRIVVHAGSPSVTGELVMDVQPDRASFPGPASSYPPTGSSIDTGIITSSGN